jgi:hypothetical protein
MRSTDPFIASLYVSHIPHVCCQSKYDQGAKDGTKKSRANKRNKKRSNLDKIGETLQKNNPFGVEKWT